MIETETKKSWNAISDIISQFDEKYSEKITGNQLRREVDWELCNSGAFTESEILKIYAETVGISLIDDDELEEIEKFPNVPIEYLNSKCCMPFKWDETGMEMLVSDPYELHNIRYFFKRLHNKDISFLLVRRSLLERKINAVYSGDFDMSEDGSDGAYIQGMGNEETLRNLASEAKIVRIVNDIFARAVESEASDIHIEPEEDKLVVRCRIDGILHEILTTALSQYPAIASRIKLVGGLNIAENRRPQDGRTNLKIGKSEMDVRISTIPTMDGESIVLRLLRKDTIDFNLKNIGMSDEMKKEFEKLVSIPHGIILVVGPTGSGKTTTLYSIMTQLNTPEKKIITIEDPVEYRIDRLSQMQVNPKIGLDFASGLRHIVRQDPDVILVGEIRDKETADIAINAALTGHLVLSTLHTNDAAGAVSRLLDMGVEGFLISSSLFGVLSQRLVRKICPKCGGTGVDYNYTGNKCKVCSSTGFKGRTGIFELMMVNDEIRSAISRESDSSTIAGIARKNGMKNIIEDGRDKVASGVTTQAELNRAAANI
jgi:type II secretory ATPase GspE/PulE/Tfp pilus assembly ATPase PilB-like protein